MESKIEIRAISGFPMIHSTCDVAEVIVDVLRRSGTQPQSGDVLAVAQKVVSKAEGRLVDLREVEVSQEAAALAEELEKEPALVEVILRESTRVEKAVRPHLITEHRLGYVCANAGVDRSNVAGSEEIVCLLPENPNRSARAIRTAVEKAFGCDVAVLITDTHGRPFRVGAVGVCIGASGIEPLRSYVGDQDLFGRTLRTSTQAIADELAAAASLVMGQADEGHPLVLIRGYHYARVEEIEPVDPWGPLVRRREHDLFRQ